jgi:hypothetical protein
MTGVPSVASQPARTFVREGALTALAWVLVLAFCASLLWLNPGFFWIDDMQSGALPGYFDMARALRSGELPLLSRFSWRAGALGAEFPAGVFSPSLAVCILIAYESGLPLPLAAATISVIHLLILAAGALRLARQRGLDANLALLVALVTTLNGWLMLWGARNWGVCLYSFAWLPWFWWALEYTRQERSGWARFVPAGLFLFLLIAAGWPLTVLMAALVSAWIMLRTWAEKRKLLALCPTPAAWAVGMGLSAPAWMMFLDFMSHGARTRQGAGLWTSQSWTVPLDGLQGLILPNVVSGWWVYGSLKPHVACELGGGLVLVTILLGCLWRGGRAFVRAQRWELVLTGLLLVLLICPSFGNFQWSFRWLPLFFLALGLLAAQSLAWLRKYPATAGMRVPNLGGIACVLVGFVWAQATLRGPGFSLLFAGVGLCTLLLSYFWFRVGQHGLTSLPARSAPVALAFFTCWTACVLGNFNCEVPTWPIREKIRDPGPLDPDVRYVSIHLDEDIYLHGVGREYAAGELYFGNAAGYPGLDFVNGYSVMMPLGLQQLFPWEINGHFAHREDARRILETETGPDGMLQRMGVDGLVLSDSFECDLVTLARNGWRAAARLEGGRVYHRRGSPSPRVRTVEQADLLTDRSEAAQLLTSHGRGPVPSVLLAKEKGRREFAQADVTLVEDGRHRAITEVTSKPGDGEILVVFSRCWFPGYVAECDGQPVPVEIYNLILPAVRLPAGTNGRVVLEYRPRAYVIGCRVAAATAVVLITILLTAMCRRSRRQERVHRDTTRTSCRCRPHQHVLSEELVGASVSLCSGPAKYPDGIADQTCPNCHPAFKVSSSLC